MKEIESLIKVINNKIDKRAKLIQEIDSLTNIEKEKSLKGLTINEDLEISIYKLKDNPVSNSTSTLSFSILNYCYDTFCGVYVKCKGSELQYSILRHILDYLKEEYEKIEIEISGLIQKLNDVLNQEE